MESGRNRRVYKLITTVFKEIEECNKCGICSGKKAYYRGSLKPLVLFVGEAPGKKEVEVGLPFVGPSGKKLDKFILQNNIENYGVTNTIMCKPEKSPTEDQIKNCRGHLARIILITQPGIIVPLGKTAYKALTNEEPSDYIKEVVFKEQTIQVNKLGGAYAESMAVRMMPIPHPRWYISHGKDMPILGRSLK